MTDLVETLKDAARERALAQAEPEILRLRKILDAVVEYQEAVIEQAEVAIVNAALAALGQPEVKPELDVAALRERLVGALLTEIAAQGAPVAAAPLPHPSSPERVEVVPLSAGQAPVVSTSTEMPRVPSEHSRKPGVSIGVPSNPLEGVNLPVPAVFVTAAHRDDDPGAFDAVLKETPLPKPMTVHPHDVEKAWALIKEVESADCKADHALRLELLFQAWAAEARLIMEKLPPGNDAHEALGERVIRAVTNLKKELGVAPYIKGLAFGSSANWHRIAANARKHLHRYDRDAHRSETKDAAEKSGSKKESKFSNPVLKTRPVLKTDPSGSSGSSASSGSPAPTSYTWPELPNLHMLMKECPLLIIGGRTKDTLKVDTIYERYGVRCEWTEIDPGSIRTLDALSERIAGGKVAAVMLVEGFLSHKVFRKITKAADLNGVPVAMAGKGGIGAIGEALQTLERLISVALFKIPKVEARPAGSGMKESRG